MGQKFCSAIAVGRDKDATSRDWELKSEVSALAGLESSMTVGYGTQGQDFRVEVISQDARGSLAPLFEKRQSLAFEAVLLPESLASSRATLRQMMLERGVGTSTYHSPHLAEQPFFAKHSIQVALPITESLARSCGRVRESRGNAAPQCRSFPKVPSSLGLFIDITLMRGWFSQ
jgi:hypothetical protein